MSEHILAAKYFCVAAHEAVGQKRKYTNEPYWQHPFRVAEMVSKIEGISQGSICAAYLHDVVEDTQVSLDTIYDLFGSDVSYTVGWLTELYTRESFPKWNRESRKKAEASRLADAGFAVQTIKVADLIDNTLSIVQHDSEFSKTYLKEKEHLLDMMTGADHKLRKYAYRIIEEGWESLES